MKNLLPALRARFRLRVIGDGEGLRRALAEGDHSEVQELAHKLSGLGGTFGFPEVSTLAERLELQAEAGATNAELQRAAAPLLLELQRIADAG